ncbi:MAG: helix-turn-helix transcriptional regulator [Bacteroidetes bacterium]|nr:helix-turn-helix transcriptional regulator [Bacteroidota bacterium]
MDNGEYLKRMGAKIRKAREAKGLFLRDLGKMCNIHYGAICEIEQGKRDSHILTLKNIADNLGVDVKDFI